MWALSGSPLIPATHSTCLSQILISGLHLFWFTVIATCQTTYTFNGLYIHTKNIKVVGQWPWFAERVINHSRRRDEVPSPGQTVGGLL